MIYILLFLLLLINIILSVSLIRYHLAVRDLSRQIEEKIDLYEIAKKLGLKTVMTLEKYR